MLKSPTSLGRMFLFLGSLLLAQTSLAGVCVVVSGLPEDTGKSFYKYEHLLPKCRVYRDFDELLAVDFTNQVLDLRVLAHGRTDGAVVCKTVASPYEIISKLNILASKNKVLASFDSCYSDQILKEKIVFDRRKPGYPNSLLHNSCFYSASTANNEAWINEAGLNDTAFFHPENIREKKLTDLYPQTTTGLLSAIPFDTMGITEVWINKDDPKPVLENISTILNRLDLSNLPQSKALTLAMFTQLSGAEFFRFSKAFFELDGSRYHVSWKPRDPAVGLEMLQSYQRLVELEGADSKFLKTIETEHPFSDEDTIYSYAQFRALCGDPRVSYHPWFKPAPLYETEPFCKLAQYNSEDYVYLAALHHIKIEMDALGITQNRNSLFPEVADLEGLEKMLLDTWRKNSNPRFDALSVAALLGNLDESTQMYVGHDGSRSRDWGSILGTLGRLSVMALNTQVPFETSEQDAARFKACQAFYYDKHGSLQFNR